METIFGPGGAAEVVFQAQREGKIRFIGFSAHTEEAALALLDRFHFTSVLYPVNWASYLNAGFADPVIKKAEQLGTARLALKALALKDWPAGLEKSERKYPKCWYEPIDDYGLADLALRFALSKPITAAIPPGDINLFRMAVQIAEAFRPIDGTELAELKRRASDIQSLFPKQY